MMANEKRLIDANALFEFLKEQREKETGAYSKGRNNGINIAIGAIRNEQICPTVDAVEVDDVREFAKDVAYQFGYYCQYEGRLHITHGGLSTLEEAFEILGWDNPHPVPECECEIDGCHEHATCGAPTADGYKRMCGRHCRERSEGE